MSRARPRLLALDFDGVVCDGMAEFFESSWRALARVFGRAPAPERRSELSARFATLRPAIESGWEMVLLLAILAEKRPDRDGEMITRWAEIRDERVRTDGRDTRILGDALDRERDDWFARDPERWLSAHTFYPGMAAWLRELSESALPVYIITTKEQRFVAELLASQRVPIPPARIIGKRTPKREKYEVLRELVAEHGLPRNGDGVWFVEDRLPTLLDLIDRAPDLDAARLFFATWGYTFPGIDGPRACASGRVQPLMLADVARGLESWPTPS